MEVETETGRSKELLNSGLQLFEKLVAASPTLIFDFLVFDIRNFNLTGKHLLQNGTRPSTYYVGGSGSVVVGNFMGWVLLQNPDGLYQGVAGAKISPEFDTIVRLKNWIETGMG